MAMVEVLPAAPAKVTGTKPLFDRPAGYVAYVPPPIPAAVPVIIQEVVSEPELVPNTKLTWWQSWWRDRDRNRLQRSLARVIQISQDHESNSVPPGDPIYQHLYTKALELCHGHFDQWHLNRDNIEIEIPCMRQLRLSAHPEATITARRVPMALFGLLAIVALPLVMGVECGLFAAAQHWIMHLFGG
jgi:hypothetical protein